MEGLLKRVYSSRKIGVSLKIISHATVLLCAVAFLFMLVHFYLCEPWLAVKFAFAAALPYVLVSFLRRIINAPRPYELYDFYEVAPKAKKGRSFPSRHVFSAFVIAVFAYAISPWLSAALLILGTMLSAVRVLLGIHFIRDVAAGALIGIISAILGLVILF